MMFSTVVILALAGAANATSLTDIKHVVMLMMENRSFNHVSHLAIARPSALAVEQPLNIC
jgi:phospholipase C